MTMAAFGAPLPQGGDQRQAGTVIQRQIQHEGIGRMGFQAWTTAVVELAVARQRISGF